MRWFLIFLAGCAPPLGQVCNPRGECAAVATTEQLGPMNDYVDYVEDQRNNFVTITINDGSILEVRVQ